MGTKKLNHHKVGRKMLILISGLFTLAAIACGFATRSPGAQPVDPRGSSALSVGTESDERANKKTCTAIRVNSVSVSTENYKSDKKSDYAPSITVEPSIAGKASMVISFGPILGAMDSPKIKTDLECTEKGVVLIATITRSADYQGAVLANVNWRPKITIAADLTRPEALFDVTWKMRLSSGDEIDHASTPPYPDQKYPITLSKVISGDDKP